MRLAELAENQRAVVKATVSRGVFAGSHKTDCHLKRWWFGFQTDAAKLGIPLRVVWGWRSWQQQEELWRAGTGAPPGKSAHNFGCALDIIHTRRGWQHMTREGWVLLSQIGKETARKMDIGLRWGGDWDGDGIPVFDDPDENFWDAAHWEIADWRDRSAIPCATEGCGGECLPALEVTFPEKNGLPGIDAVADCPPSYDEKNDR